MTGKTGAKTIGMVLEDILPRLRNNSDTPELDAQVVIAHILGESRSWVIAHPEIPLSPTRSGALESLVVRLESGEPLPYVLGKWEFFGLEFEVSPDVLIPRPETELLVHRAIGWLHAHPGFRQAADIGTGSGCIAISLAVNVADLTITATDISPKALTTARRNAERHQVADRITFLLADIFPEQLSPFPYSLIVANLPYIPTETLQNLSIFGREPTAALDGGPDGLSVIQKLFIQAREYLTPGGLLLLEIEASEGPAVVSRAREVFSEAGIYLHQDLSGNDRLLEVQV